MGAFSRKAKKKGKPSTKALVKDAVKRVKLENDTHRYLMVNLDRIITGRLRAMSAYALYLLATEYKKGREELMEYCKRIENMCWALNHSYNKYGAETNTPVIEWRDVRKNLEREIRCKLPRRPKLGNAEANRLFDAAVNEMDCGETFLMDLGRCMFGWGKINIQRFQQKLRSLDMAADYTDYLRYRAHLRKLVQVDARDVDEKTFYEGKYEKPRIKYAF